MDEVLRTGLRRARLERWEMEILLAIESCPLSGAAKRTALLEYQNAVEAQLEAGAEVPTPFTDFLARRESPEAARKPMHNATAARKAAKAQTR
jgi:hypothetical protein